MFKCFFAVEEQRAKVFARIELFCGLEYEKVRRQAAFAVLNGEI